MALFGWWQSYEPFAEMERELERFQQQVHRLFAREQRPSPEWRESDFPPLNLLEDKDNYYVHGELPGVYPGDLDIVVEGDTVAIEGWRWAAHDQGRGRYRRRERETGPFRRSIRLPGAVDRNRVSAELEHGILNMVLPKVHKTAPVQRIPVRRQ